MKNTSTPLTRAFAAALAVLPVLFGLAGCNGAPQRYSTEQYQTLSLAAKDLETHGVALITPSTVTGQEEERQAVALTFGEVLKKARPGIRVVTLPETLGAINRSQLGDEYRQMYEEYRNTGLFRRDTLAKIGQATQVRYVAQLKLSGFSQESSGRFSMFGLRVMETKRADVRLFLQIWDTRDGTVAWEGLEETTYAQEAFSEQRVTLRTALSQSATELIGKLP